MSHKKNDDFSNSSEAYKQTKEQIIVNPTLSAIVVAAAGVLLGFGLNSTWNAITALQVRVSSIEVLVAGDYVKKQELQTLKTDINKRLDNIEDMIRENQ